MYVCLCVCWRDAPFTPETACQTSTEQKGTNGNLKKKRKRGGDNRGITPEQDVTDSILTSRPATSYNLVLTIYVLCPIDAFFFFVLFLPYINEVKKTKINMQQYFIFKKRKCTSKNRHMEIIRENNPFTNKGFWLKDHLGNTNAIDDG